MKICKWWHWFPEGDGLGLVAWIHIIVEKWGNAGDYDVLFSFECSMVDPSVLLNNDLLQELVGAKRILHVEIVAAFCHRVELRLFCSL